MEQEKKKRIRIYPHPEFMKILEKMKDKMKEFTYDVIDKEIRWYHLTGILAKKIKLAGLV